MKTTIHRLQLPKAKLLLLGATERRLVLVLGHAANELSTLQRLAFFSLQGEWHHEVLDRIAIGRANVIVRLLGGKAWETIELIRRRVQEDKVAMTYIPLMVDEGRNAFERVRKTWGGSAGTILPALRKFHAFHYPSNDMIDDAFDEVGAAEPLEFYFGEKGVDGTFFQMSEIVFSVASSHVAQEADLATRIDRVSKTVVEVSGDLVRFIQHYTGTILERASNALDVEASQSEVDAVWGDEVVVPPVSVRRPA